MFDEISGQIKGRYGVNLVNESFLGAGYGIRDTQLGKVFDSARSNQTDNIVTYLSNKNTDLLKKGKAELRNMPIWKIMIGRRLRHTRPRVRLWIRL